MNGTRFDGLVYDLEILKAIHGKGEELVEGIEYCGGWGDHRGMGISVLGCYDYLTDEYRVFCGDNITTFLELVEKRRWIVGFNSARFDRKVVLHTLDCLNTHEELFIERDYDILAEMWLADGLNPDKFYWKTHGGYGLNDTCAANGLAPKRLNGALAPILWQQGKIGQVIDYCLDDVIKTKKLMDKIIATGEVYNPKTPGILKLRQPWIDTPSTTSPSSSPDSFSV